jgi:predicted Rossmann fold nucleotide-binding protein DprA/Smf involved in DNA uptake
MNNVLILALNSHALGGSPIPRKLWKAMQPVVSKNPSPEELDQWARKSLTPADADLITERLSLMEDAEGLLQEYSDSGIEILSMFDPDYPQLWLQKLGDQAPAMLHVAGNIRLLNEQAVGIVGSRDVDEAGGEFAKQAAETIVEQGFLVVSGGARGVDQIAMNAAFTARGNSVGILADSMAKTVGKRETQGAIDSGTVCLVSPFSPSAGFQVGNAMGRNKLIYALSACTLVVAAAEGTGGTWAGAVEALEKKLCPVLVRAEEPIPPAHKKLISMGGNGIASRSELVERLANPNESVAQTSLF